MRRSALLTFVLLQLGLLVTRPAFSDNANRTEPQHSSFARWKTVLETHPTDRIRTRIDDRDRVVRTGNRHPLANSEYEIGMASADYEMERMILVLQPDPTQQAALETLIEEQHDPSSPLYHRWLTPDEFGDRFGISQDDINQVVNWLQSYGLHVDEVSRGRRSILFSGSALQVERTLHTQMRTYSVRGQFHHANATEPEIPKALASVVNGVVSLHDFRSAAMHIGARPVSLSSEGARNAPSPTFSSGGAAYLSPADFATIYNVAPLYQNAIDGTGQTIAIVGRSNINVSDVNLFRSSFGLPSNPPAVIINGSNPGVIKGGEETEAALDVEWSGAVAPKAAVKFVVSASTSSSDGTYLSAQYIVNNNIAPVLSMSFGICEAAVGSSGNNFFQSLWQQAAAEGITVFVSSGDSGAAGCDGSSASTGTHGKGVNALCSTAYSVCVGGTQFDDGANGNGYWSPSNSSAKESALSYIPETVWNESGLAGGSSLYGSGGGVSSVWSKPAWQTGPGVPNDGQRDVPDVSLTAAGHDGYLIYVDGQLNVVGGTSASSPSFAGLMALVVQKIGVRQGNANSVFYPLAIQQQAGGAAVFHDIVTGDNSVPGVAGFSAGPGYDLATGLGSVDAEAMVNHWAGASSTPSFGITADASSYSLPANSSVTIPLTVVVNGGFNSAVSLSVAGLPVGVTATFAPASLAAPGSGVSMLTLKAGNAVAGTRSITITARAGTVTHTLSISLGVPAFSLSVSPATVSLVDGDSGTVTATVAVLGGFSGDIAFSAGGLPAGMTASFTNPSLAAPGAGTTVLTIATDAANLKPGSYTLTVTAAGNGMTHTSTITVRVGVPFQVTKSVQTVNMSTLDTITMAVGVTATGGFTAPISLTATGFPAGMTASFAPSSLTSPYGLSTLTLSGSPTLKGGSYTITVVGTYGKVVSTSSITVKAVVPAFSVSASASSINFGTGSTATVKLTSSVVGGFSNAVSFGVTGVPSGITAVFAPAVLDAPGSGVTTLTLSADRNITKPGVYPISIVSTANGVSHTNSITLIVSTPFSLQGSVASLNLNQSDTRSVTITLSGIPAFTAGIDLHATGVPAGMTAVFSPSSVSSPYGNTTLTLTGSSSLKGGNYPVTIAGASGSITATVSLTVKVILPNFSFLEKASSLNMQQGASGTMLLSTTVSGGFNSDIVFSAPTVPAGLTASFSPAQLAAPGAGTSILTITAVPGLRAGPYTVTLKAMGGNVVSTLSLRVNVSQ